MQKWAQTTSQVHSYTHWCTRAWRTAETPPASPAPSVSLSVLHSHAQTGPQQSQCEISCLCGALSASACVFGSIRTLGLNVYFKSIFAGRLSRGNPRWYAGACILV